VVETQFGGEGERQPSVAIIEAVAAAECVAPTELDPLYEHVDLDAVDQFFASNDDASNVSKSLRFSAIGWNVYVRGDGAIRVCDPDQQAESANVFERPLCD
jgi:hypothetical protein